MKRPLFKKWRKRRGLTQEQVIDRLAALDDPNLPQTTASLSRLENGKQIYTQRSLEALAEVYQCEADELFGEPPAEEAKRVEIPDDHPVLKSIRGLTKPQQRQAIAIIEAIRRERA